MALDPRLLEILCCPACHGDLVLQKQGEVETALDCSACGLRFPIEDGIPVMLVDKATKVS
jgi:uncharacterized protein YbaR (Trm112 family)